MARADVTLKVKIDDTELDKLELDVIKERDAWEEWCVEMAREAGCEEEWSSSHDHRVCVWDALRDKRALEDSLEKCRARNFRVNNELIRAWDCYDRERGQKIILFLVSLVLAVVLAFVLVGQS